MRGRKTFEDTHSSEDAVFFNFCSTICFIFTMGLFVASIYGIADAN